MKYGYARVSTDGQSVDAQVRQLTKAGCKKVFREVASGAKADRAQLRDKASHPTFPFSALSPTRSQLTNSAAGAQRARSQPGTSLARGSAPTWPSPARSARRPSKYLR